MFRDRGLVTAQLVERWSRAIAAGLADRDRVLGSLDASDQLTPTYEL